MFSLSLFFSLHCACILLHCSDVFLLRFELLRFSIQLHLTFGPSFMLKALFEQWHLRFKLCSRYPTFEAFSCSFLVHFHLLSLIMYYIDILFVFCGFGSVRLAPFVSVSLLSVWRHHCSTRGMFLSSLKWKNNMILMVICMIRMLLWIWMLFVYVWYIYCGMVLSPGMFDPWQFLYFIWALLYDWNACKIGMLKWSLCIV